MDLSRRDILRTSALGATCLLAGTSLAAEAETPIIDTHQHLWDPAKIKMPWLADAPARRWLLIEGRALRPCIDRARSIGIGRSNRRAWWLVPHAAVTGPCTGPHGASSQEEDQD